MQSVVRYVDWTSAGLAMLVALLTLFLMELFRLNSSRSRFPPGPTPLPFIGNLHQILKDPMTSIRALETYFGDMSTVYLGRRPTIVLNNLEIVKETFVHNGAVFSGRPLIPFLKWAAKGSGIILANGYVWKQQRRFTLHMLRNFGMGKKTVEERVMEESGFLNKEMLKHQGEPFYPIHPLMNAVSNILCSIVFGDRFEYHDKRFAKLLKILNENINLSGSSIEQIFNMLPILRFFPGPHHKFRKNTAAMQGFVCEAVEEHRKTQDLENLRDFIDAYLMEMTKQESNEDSSFCEDNMLKSFFDLFFAGTDTTANTIRWGLIYMTEHPKVQERCHEEIISVLGYDRTPTMNDRVRLPYTYATIHEVQRCANILPPGTQVMANLTAIMSDKKHWKHPDTFNPENFLDEKGQFCKCKAFLPFSLGPRVCLGETLARMELFIFFTGLLQHLHFSWPPGDPPYSKNGIVGLFRSPSPFHLICRSRDASH